MKRYLNRMLGRFGYTVLKTVSLERMSQKIGSLEGNGRLFEQNVASLDYQHKQDLLKIEHLQAEHEQNLLKLEHLEAEITALKAQPPDYQLLMQQQSLIASFDDLDPGFRPLMESVKPFTMTSVERLYTLYKAVEYICKARIPGDMLEHGVWRGGSMMLIARTLLAMGDTSRTLHLFDTYEGHPKPDEQHDLDLWGNAAVRDWEKYRKTDETSDWAYASIDEVRANLESTGYPMEKVVLVKGMVEKTAPEHSPQALSLARLDTDWYASAKVGLETCWPRLERGGVLIVDDYGHYRGQRKAVDEFFAASPVMLHRVDYSCRTVVKTD